MHAAPELPEPPLAAADAADAELWADAAALPAADPDDDAAVATLVAPAELEDESVAPPEEPAESDDAAAEWLDAPAVELAGAPEVPAEDVAVWVLDSSPPDEEPVTQLASTAPAHAATTTIHPFCFRIIIKTPM